MKKPHGMRIIPAAILLLIASVACTLEAAPEPTLDPAFRTALALPTSTPTLESSETPEPSPTAPSLPTAETEEMPGFSVWVGVDSLNLRAGPGTMFEVIGQELQGARLEALGRAPGDDWLRVRVPDGTVGYMATVLLELSGPITTLPQVSVSESYIVMGRVVDSAGEPIDDITVAVYQGTGADELRTEATTNAKGIFVAYLSLDSQYTWTASVVGVGCTSRIVDENCQYTGTFGPEATARFELPLNRQLVLTYVD